ncbi:MAG: protein kinase [Deltaproteobacteria bacterium]|nr:protein kinase [Deltaproteobacteria bacterium]
MKANFPQTFGRYQLTSLLGQGGMGRVYRATLTGPSGFRKELALKVIRPRDDGDREATAQAFVSEARLCGLLHHPNVVDVYDFGTTEGQPWLAMELVDGWPLDALLRDQPRLPPTVVLDLAIQVAEGLMHAHELQDEGRHLALVHRDLKPANVLVSRQGVAKVMDFGLARATQGAEATMSGTVRGTPAYMSPEQASGEDLDPRSDLFSFGIMLFELATGERPFLRDNIIALVMALVQVEQSLADPEFLQPADAHVPGLRAILRLCLRREPSDRFDRTRGLVDALRALLRQQPAGPSLRSWLDAVVLGNRSHPSLDLGALSVTGASDHAPHLANPPGASLGTGFAGTSHGLGVRTNIVAERSEFVGRQEDLAALGTLIDDGAHLVSVVGPAGTGKTRFVRAFAQKRMDAYLPAGGAWFCDLAPATDLLTVLSAVAAPLGVPLDRARGLEAAMDQVGYAIAGRGKVLLILDNVEQVVEPVGEALRRWLDVASDAVILVTSRERLRVAGGHELSLGPLDPDAAVQLFRARARNVAPDFAVTDVVADVVERIVRRLDYIPLAIELAAARAGVLTPAQILERLSERFKLLRSRRGGPDRQATLQGAIEWSWNLLEPDEQSALAQCSVFRGSFDLAAAEEVVALDGGWALDAIEALRDKSLVRAEQVRSLGGSIRFRLYESIREFASEQLEEEERTATWVRHARHYLDWGERQLDLVDGPKGRTARRSLALELDNLHAVFARHVETQPDLAVRAALVMTPVLLVTGPLDGHVLLIDRAVAAAEGLAAERADIGLLLARLLLVRGKMRTVRAAFIEAEEDLDAALTLARDHAERRLEGAVLAATANMLLDRGGTSDALEIARRLEALAAASSDRTLDAMALGLMGRAESFLTGAIDGSEARLEQAIALCMELGMLSLAAQLINTLAIGNAQSLRHGRATELFQQSLALHREAGNRRGQATTLANLGLLSVQAGEIERGRREFAQAMRMHERIGNRRARGILLMNLAVATGLLGELDVATSMSREGALLLQRFGSPYYIGAAWRYLSSLLHLGGRLDEAAEVLGRAEIALEGDEGGWMVASVLGCRAAIAADRDELVQADVLLSEASEAVVDRSGEAFVGLVRGHVELAQARAYRAGGDPEGARQLRASPQIRLEHRGYPEAPGAGAPHEATNRLAGMVLQRALTLYDGP